MVVKEKLRLCLVEKVCKLPLLHLKVMSKMLLVFKVLPNGDKIIFKIYDDNSSSSVAQHLIENLDENVTALVTISGSDGLLSDMQKHYSKELNLLDGILIVDHDANDMYKNALAEDLEKYFKKKNLQLSSFAGLGYESYQFLYAALKRCPGYSRECVNDALRNSEVIEGIVSIMQTTDGAMQRPIYINEIQDNKMYRKVKVY